MKRDSLCRTPPLSDLVSRETLSNHALLRIADELEAQVCASGFYEKADVSEFHEMLPSLTALQGRVPPHDVHGFIRARPTAIGTTEIVAVTYKKDTQFQRVFIRIGELLDDGEPVYVCMASLDEMVDRAWKAKPILKMLSAFDPQTIIDVARYNPRSATNVDAVFRRAEILSR